MKLRNALLIYALFALMFICTTYIITDHYKPKEQFTLEFDFYAVEGKGAGFNLDKDKMHFGAISRGGSAVRNITLTNYHSFPERAQFKIAAFNSTAADYFGIYPLSGTIILPQETKGFAIYLNIPRTALPQMYEGIILVNLYKAWPWEKSEEK